VKLLKILAGFLLVMIAALVVIPLLVLAGLFVWLKLTEEGDEESLELDQENI
jgi:flagellar basal body-associated protein FliL